MNQYPRTRALACLIGLLVSLILAGVVLAARQRALLQTTTTSYTPLTGEAEWEGNWEFSELGADPSEAGGERVTILFVGTDFALRVRRGDYRGYFFVSVDGEPANRLLWEERGAYLVLTSPNYAPQVVTIPVATGLDDGPHVVVVAAERGWDQWPLVGWSVSRTPDMTAYRWALVGLGALGFVFLAGFLWTRKSLQLKQDLGHGFSPILADRAEKSRINYIRAFISVYLRPIVGLGQSFAKRFHLGDRLALAATLIAAAAFYFSPWLPLTLISGLALAALVLLRLDLGLALVVATAPFYLHPRTLFGKAFSMAELATLLCLLSWGLRQLAAWRNRRTSIQYPVSSLDRAVLFFVIVAIASIFVAEYRHVCLLYTSPSPRDRTRSRMPSSA